MPKISVIMPVYGVERYLPQCIDSVLGQSFHDLEVIMVNDGSPDNCGQIIDQYAAKDNRVIPIHKENGGYGSAINAGLDIASGEYIAIVETDDWIELDMFESLINTANRNPESEIIKAGFNRIKNEKIINSQLFNHISSFSNSFEVNIEPKKSLDLILLESSIWTALYKRNFLQSNKIRMLESQGAAYQDSIFKFMCYALANQITLLNKPVYNYRLFAVGSSSASNDKVFVMFRNYEVVKSFLIKHDLFEQFKNAFYAHQCFDFVFHLNRLSGVAEQQFIQRAKIVVNEMVKENIDVLDLDYSDDVRDYVANEVSLKLNLIKSGNNSLIDKVIFYVNKIKLKIKNI